MDQILWERKVGNGICFLTQLNAFENFSPWSRSYFLVLKRYSDTLTKAVFISKQRQDELLWRLSLWWRSRISQYKYGKEPRVRPMENSRQISNNLQTNPFAFPFLHALSSHHAYHLLLHSTMCFVSKFL